MILTNKRGIVFAISLTLNVFCIGLLAAPLLTQRPEAAEGAERLERAGRPLLFRAGEVLGRRDDPRLRQLMLRHRPELRERRRALRAARAELRASLESDVWSEARLAAALRGLREETLASQELLHQALLELARELTPEQRARLSRLADLPAGRRRVGSPRGALKGPASD